MIKNSPDSYVRVMQSTIAEEKKLTWPSPGSSVSSTSSKVTPASYPRVATESSEILMALGCLCGKDTKTVERGKSNWSLRDNLVDSFKPGDLSFHTLDPGQETRLVKHGFVDSLSELLALTHDNGVQKLRNIIILTSDCADWVYQLLRKRGVLHFFLAVVDTTTGAVITPQGKWELNNGLLKSYGRHRGEAKELKYHFCWDLRTKLATLPGLENPSNCLYIGNDRVSMPKSFVGNLGHYVPEENHVPGRGPGLTEYDVDTISGGDWYTKTRSIVTVMDFHPTLAKYDLCQILAEKQDFPPIPQLTIEEMQFLNSQLIT
jgi:hypothetical protein